MIAIPLPGQPHHAAEHHAASISTSISTQVLGLSWDILGFLLLVYDAVISFLQFFGLPPYHAREACDRCPRVSGPWRSSSPASRASCSTTATRRWKVAKRYVRGWFSFNATVAGCDWLEFAVGSPESLNAAG